MNFLGRLKAGYGTSTVIGGVFLLIAFIIMASFMILIVRRYGELTTSLMQTLREDTRTSELSLKIIYTYEEKPSASKVMKYEVDIGESKEVGTRPLDYKEDGRYIEIISQHTLDITSLTSKEEELIENGEFTKTLEPWKVESGKGRWSSSPYDNDWGALYTVSLKGYDRASIRQSFSINEKFEKVILSFKYNLDSIGVSLQHELSLRILDRQGKVVYEDSYPTTGGKWKPELINLTPYLELGEYTIIFEVYMRGIAKFYTWLDKVSIIISYKEGAPSLSAETLPVYEAMMQFSISSDGINSSTRLFMYTNTSVVLWVYEWLADDNLWKRTSYLSRGGEWFWLEFRGRDFKLYMHSSNPFKVIIDYADISIEMLNKTGFYILIKNTGSSVSRLVSIWVNETRYPDSGTMDVYVLPTEELQISISYELDFDRNYLITVVTDEIKVVKKFDTRF